MESLRLPRFQRAPAVPAIELSDRDRLILRLVHRHRFLRSSHLIALLGGSAQPLLRRLQLLFHHGFLERPRAQLEYFHQGGSRPIVYGLGTKGGKLLKHELRLPPRRLSWGEKNRVVGRVFLEHVLFVSDVLMALELACRRSGRVRFLMDEDLPIPGQPRPAFRWNVTLDGHVRLGVVPDRVFALEVNRVDGSCWTARSKKVGWLSRGDCLVFRSPRHRHRSKDFCRDFLTGLQETEMRPPSSLLACRDLPSCRTPFNRTLSRSEVDTRWTLFS